MSLFDSSNKGLKFDTIGATHTGTVQSAPYERQQTKFGTQEPAFWPNGDPMMQILVSLQTELRDDPNDNGERTLYVASKNMKQAIGQAVREAGATDVLPGGVLSVTYVGNDPASKNPANPAKLYQARYTAPASGFVQPTAPVAAAPAAAVPPAPSAPQAAVQPVPGMHPSGLSSDQIAQLAQLRAASIPEPTIATAIGATPQQIAVFDSTPF